MRAIAKVLEMTAIELRYWLAQLRRQRTSPSHRLDCSATPATSDEFERLLLDSCEMWGLVIAGLDGALAHASGQTLRDNPYPQGTAKRVVWLVGWGLRKSHCDRTGSACTPSQDKGATSGGDQNVS
jgi:hypothetical protein